MQTEYYIYVILLFSLYMCSIVLSHTRKTFHFYFNLVRISIKINCTSSSCTSMGCFKTSFYTTSSADINKGFIYSNPSNSDWSILSIRLLEKRFYDKCVFFIDNFRKLITTQIFIMKI
jgi:hypothetical protein